MGPNLGQLDVLSYFQFGAVTHCLKEQIRIHSQLCAQQQWQEHQPVGSGEGSVSKGYCSQWHLEYVAP